MNDKEKLEAIEKVIDDDDTYFRTRVKIRKILESK